MSRKYWYNYVGTGSETDPSNYSLSAPGTNPNDYCFNGRTTCAIYATASSVNPSIPALLSSNITTYIATAKSTSKPFPVANPYVYVRPSTP